MKLNATRNPTNVTTLPDLVRFTAIAIQDILTAINGNLGFKDNLQIDLVTVQITTVNADTEIKHKLNRIPDGYITVGNPKGVMLSDGNGASTDTTITVQGNKIGTVKVLVF